MIALLRGVNVAGHRKIPMQALRDVATSVGATHVESYIQSGNLVFDAAGSVSKVHAALEKAIEARFGFPVDVVVRTAEQWRAHIRDNPFNDAATKRPEFLVLALSQGLLDVRIATALAAKGAGCERVHASPDALWIDFASGIGRSKISPALLDKAAGAPVTARNWKTVLALAEKLG